jgi:hypothetical protein
VAAEDINIRFTASCDHCGWSHRHSCEGELEGTELARHALYEVLGEIAEMQARLERLTDNVRLAQQKLEQSKRISYSRIPSRTVPASEGQADDYIEGVRYAAGRIPRGVR